LYLPPDPAKEAMRFDAGWPQSRLSPHLQSLGRVKSR
jgi:hypothetical protein